MATLIRLHLADDYVAAAPSYLEKYDPEAMVGFGMFVTTKDKAKAMRFPTPTAAIECYFQTSKTRPVRPDGKPNRPLTALTVEFVSDDG